MDHGIVTISKFEILTYRFVSMDYNWWRLISAQDRRVGDIAILLKLNSKDEGRIKLRRSDPTMSQDKSNQSCMMLKIKKPDVFESDLRQS